VSDWVLNQLKKNTQSQTAINSQALENLQKVVLNAQKELDSLLVQYTQSENRERQIISTEAYLKRKGELEGQRKAGEEKLADLQQRINNFMGDTEEKFNFAVTAAEKFNTGGYETRSTVFRNLGSNLELLDRKVLMNEDILHLFIREANKEIRTYTIDRLEPDKSIDMYEQYGARSQVYFTLRG
jgi:hypothetical protein